MSVKPALFALKDYGAVLATRKLGRTVGHALQDSLDQHSGVVLSFQHVEVASPPFLDELLSAIQASLGGGEADKLLVVAALNEDVKESLQLVLERRKIALATLDKHHIELLGGSRQLAETLRAAQKLPQFSAPELAEQLQLKLPALHQRLKVLLETGAVSRSREVATRGRHGYRAATTRDVEALIAR
jgi:DNA-binding transcriptional ArsR family regulator